MLRSIFIFLVLVVSAFACQPMAEHEDNDEHSTKAIKKDPITREIITTEKAPVPVGPYSQAVKVGNMLYLSGQIGRDPVSGEMQADSLEMEVKQVMSNLQAVLEAGGANFDHVVQTTIYLNDLNDFSEMNKIYASYFSAAPPARATVEVSNLARNSRLEIAMIAFIPEK